MPADDARRCLQDQLDLIVRATEGAVAWDTEHGADFTYLFHPDHLLVRDEDVDEVGRILAESGQFEGGGAVSDWNRGPNGGTDQADARGRQRLPLSRYELPQRLDGSPRRVPLALDLLDEQIEGLARPDHWLHVSPIGGGKICPASEPEETGLKEPWPPPVKNRKAGAGVRVVVCDTGWHPAAESDPATPHLGGVTGDDEGNGQDLREYAGHGTFVAGVVRCAAPAADVHVGGFLVHGGAILESEMVLSLIELTLVHEPQVINLSAGARTRKDAPPLSFELFWDLFLSERKDCVLVAAAGNDATPVPFWPAAFPWAVGVGSLDRDGRVSSFSNYCHSADVYALGRNHINAFPHGTLVCHETPDKGDVRVFDTGLARWSGTSFSSPLVAGLIAARIGESGEDAPTARDAVLASAAVVADPMVGPIRSLRAASPA